MPGVTRSVTLEPVDLETIRGDVRSCRTAAAKLAGEIPAHLIAARAGAQEDRERRDRLLELLMHATRVTFEVPEGEG